MILLLSSVRSEGSFFTIKAESTKTGCSSTMPLHRPHPSLPSPLWPSPKGALGVWAHSSSGGHSWAVCWHTGTVITWGHKLPQPAHASLLPPGTAGSEEWQCPGMLHPSTSAKEASPDCSRNYKNWNSKTAGKCWVLSFQQQIPASEGWEGISEGENWFAEPYLQQRDFWMIFTS